MKEKTLKKIKKLLEKADVEEEKINSIIAELQEDEGDEEKTNPTTENEEGSEETPNPDKVNQDTNDNTDVTTVDEQGADAVPPSAPSIPMDVPPEGDVPPSDVVPGSIEDVVQQAAATESEVPPIPPQEVPPTPVTPQLEDPQIQELVNRLDESEKARVALQERIDSLENSLKAAGILEDNATTPLGDERPNLPESEETQASNTLDSVLRQINGK